MFRFLNGRLIGENISFEPPENFFMIVRRAEFFDDGFMFVSVDNSIKITITLERDAIADEGEVYDFIEERSFRILGDIQKIKRGTRTVFGFFYGYGNSPAGAYKEVFTFRRNKHLENQVIVTVELDGWLRGIGNNIYAVMDLPPIKNFFNSIEYRCY